MSAVSRVLLSRWFLWPLGAFVLSLIVWFGGPLTGIGFLDSWIVRASIVGGIWLIVGIVLLVGSLRRRSKEKKLVAGMSGASEPRDPTADAIGSERAQLEERLKAAVVDLNQTLKSKGGQTVYELPWYAIIGPPGAGKTTALLNSGLRFPLAERHGAQALRGVGGTRNCDWWFTERAVILDTAGRYTTQDSDATIDNAGWNNFLQLLKGTRPKQPLNGILVVFGVPELLATTHDQRVAHARAVRTRLIELQETFGITLPIYIVLTKLDMIAGFVEFFDDLDREGREQVLGLSFPMAVSGGEGPQGKFGPLFDRLVERERSRVLDRLQQERDLGRRTLIFGFPPQFASLGLIIDDLLKETFDDSRFANRLSLRGVYFTSATQQGSPIDRLMGVISAKFGVSQPPPPPQVGAGRGFFLRRLFDDLIFNEAGLVGTDPKIERRTRLIRRSAFAATVLLTLGALGAWGASYLDNTRLIGDVQAAVERLEPQIRAAERAPLGDGDPRPILPVLDELRKLPAGYAAAKADKSEAIGLGLGQQDRLELQAIALYRRSLLTLLRPRMLVRAQQQLALRLGDPDYAYGALKTYLMLGESRHYKADWIRRWFDNDYQTSGFSESERAALLDHIAAMGEEGFPSAVRLDQALIADARGRIRNLSMAERALRSLADRDAVKAIPAWSVLDHLGPGTSNADRVFRRASAKPLTEGVPGLYTREGFYEHFIPALPGLLKEVIDDAWVFGEEAERVARGERPKKELADLYMSNYIAAWKGLMTDMRIYRLTDIRQAAELLGIIADPAVSPVRYFYQNAALEVRLSMLPGTTRKIPPGAPGADRLLAAYKQQLELSIFAVFGGENPARIVDNAFRDLIVFVGPPDAPTTPLTAFQVTLRGVATKAEQSIAGAGGSPVELVQVATQIKTSVARLPPELRPPMLSLAGDAEVAGKEEAQRQIRAQWQQDVMTACQQIITGRFPLVKGAGSEVPMNDFGRLFGPQQLIDSFFNTNIKPHVDTAGKPWKPVAGAVIVLTPAAIEMFERAADIRDAFFGQGSPIPGVGFSLVPLQVEVKGTAVEIDGQVLQLDPANLQPLAMSWPRGAGGGKVIGEKGPLNEYLGAWAFMRLFDAASLARRSDDRWEATLSNGARVEVQWRSVKNPMASRATLERFRCVPL